MNCAIEMTGKGSRIFQSHHPSIVASQDKSFEIGLLSFVTFNNIPNIEEGVNNRFCYDDQAKYINFPTGGYELDDINKILQTHLGGENIAISANINTLKTEITSKFAIDFSIEHTFAALLGFEKKKLPPGFHVSELPVDILKVHSISVNLNIAEGSYKNGIKDRCIYQVIPNVPTGYLIASQPATVIFFPVNTRNIQFIEITLRDQNNELVNLRGELVTTRLLLREVNHENNL
jgi:hypothetical protein